MSRCVPIGFVTLRWLFAGLIGVLVVAGPAAAETVKCQKRAIEAEIIVHERNGAVSVIGTGELAALDVSFRAFVTEVLDQLPALLERAGLCTADAEPVMQVQFVHVPLVADAFIPHAFATEAPQEVACRVTSPWVYVSDVSDRKPRLRARFIWNERQVLFDQAVLSGAAADPLPLEPIDSAAFGRFATVYANEEISGKSPPMDALPISSRILPDLLWLFRVSFQTTRGPFGGIASRELTKVLKQTAPRQGLLALGLVQQCIEGLARQSDFNTIWDMGGTVLLDTYRSETSRKYTDAGGMK
jgi:hypothetical protein